MLKMIGGLSLFNDTVGFDRYRLACLAEVFAELATVEVQGVHLTVRPLDDLLNPLVDADMGFDAGLSSYVYDATGAERLAVGREAVAIFTPTVGAVPQTPFRVMLGRDA